MVRITDEEIDKVIEKAIKDEIGIEDLSNDCLLGYEIQEQNSIVGLFPSNNNRYIIEVGLKSDGCVICHKEVVCMEQIGDILELYNMELAKYFKEKK